MYTVRVFDKNNPVPLDERKGLTAEFAQISWKATGGPDWQRYEKARDGWAAYYLEEGARPQDYDRLIIVQNEGRVVHFTGLGILTIGDKNIIWVHVTITDPDFQEKGALKIAIASLFDPVWLKTLGSRIPIIFRTPNPIVYEAMRNIAKNFMHPLIKINSWHPEINAEGTIDPIPAHIKETATEISKQISPECTFDPDKFIIHGYYKRYGALYNNHNFPCRDRGLQDFFRSNLDDSNEDGFFILIDMTIV